MPSERITDYEVADGRLTLGWGRGDEGKPGEVVVSLFWDGVIYQTPSLNRSELNQFIRALRRARSQAFGDE